MKKTEKIQTIEENSANSEDLWDSGSDAFKMDSEAPQIEYTIGMSIQKIQEIFESIPISPRKEDLILNIKKLEDVYNFLLNRATTVNENLYNEISEKESKRLTEELERLQKEMEKKTRLLEEEVSNNIKMHNDLRNKHLAEIQKIYQQSKDNLLSEAIMMVSKYLNITLEGEPKVAKN
jgi:flagellar motility protein MotE (MotC chaperone)